MTPLIKERRDMAICDETEVNSRKDLATPNLGATITRILTQGGIGALIFGLVASQNVAAQVATTVSPNTDVTSADIHIANATIPFSGYASAETKQALAKLLASPPPPDFHGDIEAVRRYQAQYPDTQLAKMRKRYAVTITPEEIGGVRVRVIVPQVGVAKRNRNRILINLHGGGFMWGADSEALVESIPFAIAGDIKIVTVDFRMAPEHTFPAASEDVAAVYRALLRKYKPENIGIYGCSAGGILAAESIAWFEDHDLPRPGAIASLCGTGAELDGDSAYLASVLIGQPAVPPGGTPLLLKGLPYFAGVKPDDPLAFPITSRKVLAKFPPTLLITGSRDFSESSETTMKRRLWRAGVESELFVFDGLWHAFMMDPDLPESQEVYAIVARFFDDHLGRNSRSAMR